MHVFWYRYTHMYTRTHTRAFKVQNLTKRFNQSRLDFLPELGYVYICYSILKPSNYVLSCTPSHTLTRVWLVWLHQWQLALPTPHGQIFTQTCWLIILHPLLAVCAWALQTILLSALWWQRYSLLIGWYSPALAQSKGLFLLLRLLSAMRFKVFLCLVCL